MQQSTEGDMFFKGLVRRLNMLFRHENIMKASLHFPPATLPIILAVGTRYSFHSDSNVLGHKTEE